MSRASYIILAIVILLASVGVVGWSFFGLGTSNPAPQSKPQGTKQATQSAKSAAKGSSQIPIGIDNPAVYMAKISYGFRGKIIRIDNTPKGLEIVTDLKIPNIPRFFVTPKTTVSFLTNGKKTKTSSSTLALNQTVGIAISYELKKKAWNTVANVNIITEEKSTSIPSAKTQ